MHLVTWHLRHCPVDFYSPHLGGGEFRILLQYHLELEHFEKNILRLASSYKLDAPEKTSCHCFLVPSSSQYVSCCLISDLLSSSLPYR